MTKQDKIDLPSRTFVEESDEEIDLSRFAKVEILAVRIQVRPCDSTVVFRRKLLQWRIGKKVSCAL